MKNTTLKILSTLFDSIVVVSLTFAFKLQLIRLVIKENENENVPNTNIDGGNIIDTLNLYAELTE